MNSPPARKNSDPGKSWVYPDVVQPSFQVAEQMRGSGGNKSTAAPDFSEQALGHSRSESAPVKSNVCRSKEELADDAVRELVAATDALREAQVVAVTSHLLEQIVEKLVEKKFSELVNRLGLITKSPLAGARSRGSTYKQTELAKAENASLLEASRHAGISERTINKWRQRGWLYALLHEGKKRGYRYPLWQFNADHERLAKALAPFHAAQASAWVVHNFFELPNSSLADRTPRDWVLDPAASIEQLVKVAHLRFAGDQGAS